MAITKSPLENHLLYTFPDAGVPPYVVARGAAGPCNYILLDLHCKRPVSLRFLKAKVFRCREMQWMAMSRILLLDFGSGRLISPVEYKCSHTLDMCKKYVLAAFLHLVCILASKRRVAIRFTGESGNIAETKEYNTCRTVFAASEYLRNEIGKHCLEAPEQKKEDALPQITLECPRWAFDMTADLLDNKLLDVEVRASEVAGVLQLTNLLSIGDKKAALYRNLAQATINDADFRSEMKKYVGTPDIKLFMLHLLKEYASIYGMYLKVIGHRVLLRLVIDMSSKENSLKSRVGVVDEMNITFSAMSNIRTHDRDALGALKSFVHLMGIRRLSVDYCKLDTEAIKCIGEMKGLTMLSMRSHDEPRNLKYLRNLKSLVELDISGSRLGEICTYGFDMLLCHIGEVCVPNVNLSAIGSLENLVRLRMENCRVNPGSLAHIKGLERLTELNVRMNRLTRGDMMVIGGMKSLSKLDVGYCKVEPESMFCLQDLSNLAELDVSGNRLSIYDMVVVGSMSKLTKLCISRCILEPRGFESLRHLANLRELDVSRNELEKEDMSVIGEMEGLAVLNMHACNLRPGSLEHIKSLRGLLDLDVSGNSLSRSDVAIIGGMGSLRRLHVYDCELELGSLLHFENLKNLEDLHIYGLTTPVSQDYKDVMSDLRLRGVRVYTH